MSDGYLNEFVASYMGHHYFLTQVITTSNTVVKKSLHH